MLGKFIIILPVCLSSLIIVPAVPAAVILSEDFNYPDGPLVTVSEGRWKTHSGTGEQAAVVSGCLKLSQSLSEDVSALLDGEPYGVEQAEALYVGFLASFSALPSGANGTYFAHFKDASATAGFRGRIFATTNSASAGALRLGVAAAANNATDLLPVDLQLNTAYRVVCRMALSDNATTLWLNPASESDPSVTSTDMAVAKAITSFALRQSLSSGAGMGELAVDELVVATTFEEVVTASSSPAIVVRIGREVDGAIRLRWAADPELSYSVLQADSAVEHFSVVAAGLQFLEGDGEYLDSGAEAPARFYCVCSP
jgi:hypothetical protein